MILAAAWARQAGPTVDRTNGRPVRATWRRIMNSLCARQFVLVVAATIALPLSRLDANPIFAENFEAYAQGSNISGQGGWVGNDIRVGVGNGLGSKALDGGIYVSPPGYMPSFTVNQFAPGGLSQSHLYVLTFDAYARQWSHDAGVYFYAPTHYDQGLSIGWWVVGTIYTNVPLGWMFDARGLTGDENALQPMGIAVDRPVTLQVVLDPANGRAWGVADFGSGTVTTNQIYFDPSRVSGITGVIAHMDFRGLDWLDAELDNIVVNADVPVGVTESTWGATKALFR